MATAEVQHVGIPVAKVYMRPYRRRIRTANNSAKGVAIGLSLGVAEMRALAEQYTLGVIDANEFERRRRTYMRNLPAYAPIFGGLTLPLRPYSDSTYLAPSYKERTAQPFPELSRVRVDHTRRDQWGRYVHEPMGTVCRDVARYSTLGLDDPFAFLRATPITRLDGIEDDVDLSRQHWQEVYMPRTDEQWLHPFIRHLKEQWGDEYDFEHSPETYRCVLAQDAVPRHADEDVPYLLVSHLVNLRVTEDIEIASFGIPEEQPQQKEGEEQQEDEGQQESNDTAADNNGSGSGSDYGVHLTSTGSRTTGRKTNRPVAESGEESDGRTWRSGSDPVVVWPADLPLNARAAGRVMAVAMEFVVQQSAPGKSASWTGNQLWSQLQSIYQQTGSWMTAFLYAGGPFVACALLGGRSASDRAADVLFVFPLTGDPAFIASNEGIQPLRPMQTTLPTGQNVGDNVVLQPNSLVRIELWATARGPEHVVDWRRDGQEEHFFLEALAGRVILHYRVLIDGIPTVEGRIPLASLTPLLAVCGKNSRVQASFTALYPAGIEHEGVDAAPGSLVSTGYRLVARIQKKDSILSWQSSARGIASVYSVDFSTDPVLSSMLPAGVPRRAISEVRAPLMLPLEITQSYRLIDGATLPAVEATPRRCVIRLTEKHKYLIEEQVTLTGVGPVEAHQAPIALTPVVQLLDFHVAYGQFDDIPWIDVTDFCESVTISASQEGYSIEPTANLTLYDRPMPRSMVAEQAAAVGIELPEGDTIMLSEYLTLHNMEYTIGYGWYRDPSLTGGEGSAEWVDLGDTEYTDNEPEPEWTLPFRYVFTGFTVRQTVQRQATAPRIQVSLETYLAQLKHTPVIMSWYYDGMYAVSAINHLISTAGLLYVDADGNIRPGFFAWEDSRFIVDAGNPLEYSDPFRLGIGQDWRSAQFQFAGDTSVYECVRRMCEAPGYFLTATPWGYPAILVPTSSVLPNLGTLVYYTYPSDDHDPLYDILARELSITWTPHDRFNSFVLNTVDRDDRRPISVLWEEIKDDTLDLRGPGYEKMFYETLPRLGSLRAALQTAARRLRALRIIPRSVRITVLANYLIQPGVRIIVYEWDPIRQQPRVLERGAVVGIQTTLRRTEGDLTAHTEVEIVSFEEGMA